jgi:hypothetical protein
MKIIDIMCKLRDMDSKLFLFYRAIEFGKKKKYIDWILEHKRYFNKLNEEYQKLRDKNPEAWEDVKNNPIKYKLFDGYYIRIELNKPLDFNECEICRGRIGRAIGIPSFGHCSKCGTRYDGRKPDTFSKDVPYWINVGKKYLNEMEES